MLGRTSGFSLVEALVASAVALSVMAGALGVVARMRQTFETEAEVADAQQRLRVGADAVFSELLMAGAGAYQGSRAGPLYRFTAPVLPFRQGASNSDPPATFKSDTLTFVFASRETSSQTTTQTAVSARSGSIAVNADPGCPSGDPLCGFKAGMDVIVYDDTGSYDSFRVDSAQGSVLQVTHTMPDTSQVYGPGATIVEATTHTFHLNADAATGTYQLMRSDGVGSDAVVLDHVVELGFEYYGEPGAPALLKPVSDPVGPWTTYGPKPPPIGAQPTGYPAGENCAFQLDDTGTAYVPRLGQLGDGSTTLVRLTARELTDGPWCPDGTNAHRFDADLFRVRKIQVTLRLEAATTALRGPAGVLFAHEGTSRSPARWAPDQVVRFQVTPRNLNAGR